MLVDLKRLLCHISNFSLLKVFFIFHYVNIISNYFNQGNQDEY